MTTEKFYTLILKIALEYRLSLENICIILGIESTEENQKNIYNIFEKLFSSDGNLKTVYDFLFKYETRNEPMDISLKSLNSAYLLFNRFKVAYKNKDSQKINEILEELNALDNRIKELRYNRTTPELTEEDCLDLIRYKIKYSITSTSDLTASLGGSASIDYLDFAFKFGNPKFEYKLKYPDLSYKLGKLAKYDRDIIDARKANGYNIDNVFIPVEDEYPEGLMEMCLKQL